MKRAGFVCWAVAASLGLAGCALLSPPTKFGPVNFQPPAAAGGDDAGTFAGPPAPSESEQIANAIVTRVRSDIRQVLSSQVSAEVAASVQASLRTALISREQVGDTNVTGISGWQLLIAWLGHVALTQGLNFLTSKKAAKVAAEGK